MTILDVGARLADRYFSFCFPGVAVTRIASPISRFRKAEGVVISVPEINGTMPRNTDFSEESSTISKLTENGFPLTHPNPLAYGTGN